MNSLSSSSNMSGSVVKDNVSVMFADVAGSTRIYDTLGDAAAEKCISDCLKMMARVVNAQSGQVVKTIGDEIMARFSNADDAYLAAKKIQSQCENILVESHSSIQVRIGMHTGSVIEKDNDIFGDAVNIAARMAGIAKARQIMLSEDMFSKLNQEYQSSSRFFDRAQVKGKEKALNIYQVVWEDLNQTNIISTPEDSPISAANGGLILVYNGQGSFISNAEGSKAFTIGRGVDSDLMINSDFASRSHLEIEWKRDKYQLTDHSTNGTTVRLEGGDSVFLKRESFPLMGKGSFMLGVDDKHLVTFEILASHD